MILNSIFVYFWFPAIASGTYKFTSVRPCVRPSEISESVHRNFLKFGTKLVLPNATGSDIFGFCPKNPVWPVLGQFRSKNALFSPKMDILANYSETSHRILLILHYLNYILGLSKSSGKNLVPPILGPF